MKLGLVWLSVLFACGGNGNAVPVMHDASDLALDASTDESPCPDNGSNAACSVLTQAGCCTGTKCTWALSTDPTPTAPGLGSITCEPQGTVAIGGACTILPAAQHGYDDCVGGSVCVAGTCKEICDNNGGTLACGADQACVTIDGLFANEGATTIPAGVCEPSCNPLDDNDFDGSGTLHTKTGTACGTNPLEACVGFPSAEITTAFHCEHSDGQLANGELAPVPPPTTQVCLPGYAVGFVTQADGAMDATCFAFCKPGDTYLGNPNPQAPNGVSPHGCNDTDALGEFGNIPNGSADSNGAHCEYSWVFERNDATGAVHHSPTSDTLGICINHTKYKYDSNGDGMMTADDDVIPPCAALPLHASMIDELAATDVGCVSTVTGGVTSTPSRHRVYIPDLPQFLSFSSH